MVRICYIRFNPTFFMTWFWFLILLLLWCLASLPIAVILGRRLRDAAAMTGDAVESSPMSR